MNKQIAVTRRVGQRALAPCHCRNTNGLKPIASIVKWSICFLLLLLASTAFALTSNWTNTAGGNWNVAGNWSNGVPGPNDTARIAAVGTYTVTLNATADVEMLILGGPSANATLLVTGGFNFECGVGTQIACRVDTTGILDVSSTFEIASTAAYSVYDYGQIIVRNGGTLDLFNTSMYVTPTGELDLDGGSDVIQGFFIFAEGAMNVTGSIAQYTGGINIGVGGVLNVDGELQCNDVYNDGLIAIQESGVLNLVSPDGIFASSLINNTIGTVRFDGAGTITGENLDAFQFASFLNDGIFSTEVDTAASFTDLATVECYFRGDNPTFSSMRLITGNLEIEDTTSVIDDSTCIAAGCTLRVNSIEFTENSRVGCLGTVHFVSDTSLCKGKWYLDGGIYLTGLIANPTKVYFDPDTTVAVDLGSLNLGSTFAHFTAPELFPVGVDTITQNGGTMSGYVLPASVYNWQSGVLSVEASTGGFSITQLIPVGVTINLQTGGSKEIDSLELKVEGAANFQDSGVLTLVDTAVVNIDPLGTLDVGPGFKMLGIGKLYNSGDADFDAQADTIAIDVPVINSTVARTPGTIDILSGRVVFGFGGHNDGTVNIADSAELVIHRLYENYGVMFVGDEAALTIEDTLINYDGSELRVESGGTIQGDGLVLNGGEISSGGTFLLTPDNVMCEVELVNCADSGFVNVVADTLTLAGDAVNRGTITIQAGAVLRVLGNFVNDTSGLITGNGTLDISDALSFSNFGTISPGLSPGALTVNGSFALTSTSVLRLEISGATPSLYDQLLINGSIVLGGTLELALLGGFVPGPADLLNLLSSQGLSGEFATITGRDAGGGQFIDFTYEANTLVCALCTGDPEIVPVIPSVADTIITSEDVFLMETVGICNEGECLLNYAVSLVNVSPAFVPHISLDPADLSAHITRTNCRQVEVYVDATGLAFGDYHADLQFISNDPSHSPLIIPMNFNVALIRPIRVRVRPQSSPANTVKVMWRSVAGASQYNVHADNSPNGSFPTIATVLPPDTSLNISTVGFTKQFYHVTVVLPDTAASPAVTLQEGPSPLR